MANTNIKEYMNELAKYDFAVEFEYYDNGCISDIISEIADSGISCNTYDQIEYAMEHADSADMAISDGLVDMTAHTSFSKLASSVGACAWYIDNEQTINENLDECVLYAVCYYLASYDGIEELTEKNVSDLEALEFDNCDRLEDVIEEAENVLGLNEDEDEDED